MSKSQFCKEFIEYYGCSAFKMLIDIRLSYAYNSIMFNGNIYTRDIAYEVGFEDVSYFCRAFKKKYGKKASKIKKWL